MARTSEKVGRGPCPHCGERVTFHRTAKGLLNYECDACDHSSYAHKGGNREREWLASIDQPAAAPVAAAAPSADPVPALPSTPAAPAKRNSVFSLGAL